MNAIVVEGNISPRISFIVSLLDEAVKCGPKHSKYILQMLPHNMVWYFTDRGAWWHCVDGQTHKFSTLLFDFQELMSPSRHDNWDIKPQNNNKRKKNQCCGF